MSQISPRVLARSRLTSTASNFSLVIGSGAKSVVYKGFMDDRAVAIKLLSKPVKEENFQILLDFWRLDHPNVVKLLATCNDGMQALVYEFVPNNTLRFHLQGEQTNARLLSWGMRMSILLGIAKGIHYLHNQAWMRVIHGSITSSNVMLDSNWTPKLSDVGVSQLLLKDVPMDSLVGTEYLDQEFFNGGILTTESDVYSFGIVILETISGRGPRVPRPGQTAVTDSILIWVEKQFNSGHVRDLVDRRCPDIDQIGQDTVAEIVTLAMRCCERSRVRRPSTNVVIETLEKVLNGES
ncbi:hypothetical protein CBR_g24326 [Chara braunii]|uniref:Protein kinase domain-containing protein n=1 Tax=Chara braunii TaxID=69332 RepID=A0A388JMF5_CHABU|nr:hypothetical protein CBR_g24326 [Chara braunii]|eukprot:GBG58977.1 hypothetical protein CBR_g24326 [Chara braunii]